MGLGEKDDENWVEVQAVEVDGGAQWRQEVAAWLVEESVADVEQRQEGAVRVDEESGRAVAEVFHNQDKMTSLLMIVWSKY